MKILWVSNSPIGPAARILGENYSGTSGSWIVAEYEKLNKTNNEFFFLCSSRSVKAGQVVKKTSKEGSVYCVNSPRLCYGIKNPPHLVKAIEEIIEETDPDIIQIWGTETCISNIVASVATRCKKVVFMQGLMGVHQRYLGGGLNMGEYKEKPRFFEYLREALRRKYFIKQVAVEKDTLKKCGNAIIDGTCAKAYVTTVDENIKAITYKLSPNEVFYKAKWDFSSCEKHSVFTVFSGNAEKGLHQLIKALALVRKRYPDVKLRVPGAYNINEQGRLVPKTYYERIVNELITKNGLSENVEFLGKLSQKEMALRLEKANCFVNPSVMENHALSLREALIVGVPSISTVCGSVSDYVVNGKNGFLYRYEEYEVLAELIERVFEMKEGFAARQNDYLQNDDNLLTIYNSLV